MAGFPVLLQKLLRVVLMGAALLPTELPRGASCAGGCEMESAQDCCCPGGAEDVGPAPERLAKGAGHCSQPAPAPAGATGRAQLCACQGGQPALPVPSRLRALDDGLRALFLSAPAIAVAPLCLPPTVPRTPRVSPSDDGRSLRERTCLLRI